MMREKSQPFYHIPYKYIEKILLFKHLSIDALNHWGTYFQLAATPRRRGITVASRPTLPRTSSNLLPKQFQPSLPARAAKPLH